MLAPDVGSRRVQPDLRHGPARARLLRCLHPGRDRGEVSRLFTHETRDAYRLLLAAASTGRARCAAAVEAPARLVQALFVAFTEKLSPARRLLYGASLVFAVLGLLQAFTGLGVRWIPAGPSTCPCWRPPGSAGPPRCSIAFVLVNLLVLIEVADRLSLKNDLEIARDIQHAMLRHDTYRAPGVETFGRTRPANTVGRRLLRDRAAGRRRNGHQLWATWPARAAPPRC